MAGMLVVVVEEICLFEIVSSTTALCFLQKSYSGKCS
jgi:hypothetical protein